MKKEDIEKAANAYMDDFLYDHIDYTEINYEEDNYEAGRNNALCEFGANIFTAGANWRINSTWHEPAIEAVRNVDMLIEDIRGKFTVHKFYLEKWENMVKIYEIKRWAYIEDLILNKK